MRLIEGKKFEVLDEVILGVGKPKWSPTKEDLAYIAGGEWLVIGGFKNKKLKWHEFPVNGILTPKNFAELDFTWTDAETLITSRVKEKDWSNDPKNQPLPTLYMINLANKNETPVTKPPTGFGDYHPQYLGKIHKLIWLRRRNLFDKHEMLWISEPDGTNARARLKNVEEVAIY